MGCGTWTTSSYLNYSTSKGRTVTDKGVLAGNYSAQDLYTFKRLQKELNPLNAMRECCDTEEHPNTTPVILALDVTGSMGDAAVQIAKKLNVVMTELYEKVSDVEFLIMGIGDLAYDDAPIQASQFESDIRIAEQLDKVYFEFGGGGNSFESYSAAWYFGLYHTKLDCWKRNKKGLIITIGDELLNPYLPVGSLTVTTGDNLQTDVQTQKLFDAASQKFDIYHLNVKHGMWVDSETNENSFKKIIGEQCVKTVDVDSIADAIINIVTAHSRDEYCSNNTATSGEISW